MRLRWTTPATQDLYRIVQHIQEDNPTAAAEVAKTIYDGCDTLSNFPRRGPHRPDPRDSRTDLSRAAVYRCLPD
jgi:plasmid stabilization system protein ParE